MNDAREAAAARRPEPRDAGQALVEFALVVPLLLILVIGIFEFGRAWNAYQVVTDAAREGARNAVVDNDADSAAVAQIVRDALARAALDAANAGVDIEGMDSGRGSPTTVSVQYPYEFVFLGPLLGWLSDKSSITLTSRFVMRNE